MSDEQDTETNRESAAFNKQAARRLADKRGFDIEEIRVCVKCGRTVIQNDNLFSDDRQDTLYCTCDPVGWPMVRIEEDDNDD